MSRKPRPHGALTRARPTIAGTKSCGIAKGYFILSNGVYTFCKTLEVSTYQGLAAVGQSPESLVPRGVQVVAILNHSLALGI
jgi:hypothetical protein